MNSYRPIAPTYQLDISLCQVINLLSKSVYTKPATIIYMEILQYVRIFRSQAIGQDFLKFHVE